MGRILVMLGRAFSRGGMTKIAARTYEWLKAGKWGTKAMALLDVALWGTVLWDLGKGMLGSDEEGNSLPALLPSVQMALLMEDYSDAKATQVAFMRASVEAGDSGSDAHSAQFLAAADYLSNCKGVQHILYSDESTADFFKENKEELAALGLLSNDFTEIAAGELAKLSEENFLARKALDFYMHLIVIHGEEEPAD